MKTVKQLSKQELLALVEQLTAQVAPKPSKNANTEKTIYSVSISNNGNYWQSLPTFASKAPALKIFNAYKSLNVYNNVKLSSAITVKGKKVTASDWILESEYKA